VEHRDSAVPKEMKESKIKNIKNNNDNKGNKIELDKAGKVA
jgi:hypothetical protein